MKYIIALSVLLFSTLSLAALVPVHTSQYTRGTGSPTTNSVEVEIKNPGEIRISNINLEDGAVELVESTSILLNGTSVLSPFHLPHGGSVVFPLDVGTYSLETTLNGKPAGGVSITFYEDQPDSPPVGKGWELLNDGTVLHRKTNLIWHRNVRTPGIDFVLWPATKNTGLPNPSIEEYVANLNAGLYGTDTIYGNSNQTDWRVPTPSELYSAMDQRASYPAIADKNGDAITYPYPRMGTGGGMEFGDPLYICDTDGYSAYITKGWITNCSAEWNLNGQPFITLYENPEGDWGEHQFYISVYSKTGDVFSYDHAGFVWPVRGEQ